MLGPFATASRRYIAIHHVSLLSHASYSYSAGRVRCPRRRRRQRQRVTEGTAMAPWNGPNKKTSLYIYIYYELGDGGCIKRAVQIAQRRARADECINLYSVHR